MPRKWNSLGRNQVAVLRMVARVGKTEAEILNRLKSPEPLVVIQTLVDRGLLVLKNGKYHPTDHGKAITMMPEQYKKWREMWGLA